MDSILSSLGLKSASPPPPTKISLYSLSDLKSTTDDALPLLLTSLPAPYTFTQQHTLSTVRLTLGYTAVTIAGALFYFDWVHGWDVTKPYTLPACVVYFILNTALTYWIWAVEKGTVFVGVRQGGQKVSKSLLWLSPARRVLMPWHPC
jgi:hypothetical protein